MVDFTFHSLGHVMATHAWEWDLWLANVSATPGHFAPKQRGRS